MPRILRPATAIDTPHVSLRYHAHMTETDPMVEQAYAALRSHYGGDLRFDDHLRPVQYVMAPDGALIAPVMAAMLSGFNMVLFIPDNSDDALQLQISIEPFKEDTAEGGALADRWRIYHGEPVDVFWGRLNIDAAKFQGYVIDGEALMRPNPLTEHAPRICRSLNSSQRDAVKSLCEQFARTDVAQPVVVGIDPLGIDVRRKFDVIRVPFHEPQPSADAALAELAKMMQRATGGPLEFQQ